MKTRDELLAMAEEALKEVTKYPTDNELVHVVAAGFSGILTVMLAKEMREGENTPTHEQMERLVSATEGIPHALWHKD